MEVVSVVLRDKYYGNVETGDCYFNMPAIVERLGRTIIEEWKNERNERRKS